MNRAFEASKAHDVDNDNDDGSFLFQKHARCAYAQPYVLTCSSAIENELRRSRSDRRYVQDNLFVV